MNICDKPRNVRGSRVSSPSLRTLKPRDVITSYCPLPRTSAAEWFSRTAALLSTIR